MSLLHLFRTPGLSPAQTRRLLTRASGLLAPTVTGIRSEACYNIQATGTLGPRETETLTWLLSETFHPEGFSQESILSQDGPVLEVGPRMNFTTAWSTNAVGICHACGLGKIRRIERSRRFILVRDQPLDEEEIRTFLSLVHDRMTELQYPEPLTSFETGMAPE
ncbi:MAG: phosphoribosylformylglycinamidine synthase, partial [Gemmatimonadota bacterium]